MGTNRKLKTDGNLEIESNQVDINSDIDVSGDVGATTVTTTSDATVGGDASITGNVSCVDVDATGDLGGATATVTGNATVGGTIEVTGQATLSGLAYPTSDGTADQVLVTNGFGTLSFADAASGGGGGADIDIIASASDATNYTGTAKFIHITSTVDVTFTNATIENRIIYNLSNSNVTFECDNFLSNIYKSDGSGSLYIKSKGDGTDSGVTYNSTNVKGCDISTGSYVYLYAGSHDPAGTGEVDLLFLVNQCRINSSVRFDYNSTGYGKHYIGSSNLTGYYIYNQETRDDSLNLRYGTRIEAGYFYGYANIIADSTINAGGSYSGTVKIENGTDTFVNGVYNYPFTAYMDGIKTNATLISSTNTSQQISSGSSTTIVFEDVEIDNTSSYNSTTGIFTAKVAGIYRINSSALFSSNSSFDSGEYFYIDIDKNGSDVARGYINQSHVTNTSSYSYGSNVLAIVNLAVGDEIRVTAIQNSGVAQYLNGVTYSNYFHINKIN